MKTNTDAAIFLARKALLDLAIALATEPSDGDGVALAIGHVAQAHAALKKARHALTGEVEP